MKRSFIFWILLNLSFAGIAQPDSLDRNLTLSNVSICSWNLKDFGKTKSSAELNFIANVVKSYDIVAIQEVVAKDPGGAKAVAALNDILNRMGNKWDYVISDPTFSSSYKAERYAFLWKTSRIKKKGEAWLEKKYQLEIDREPYYASFTANGKEFTVVNFHAIRKDLQPETEIKFFKYLPEEYPSLTLIFACDFNCPQNHTVFNPLKKMGYLPALIGQKTTLKKSCVEEECLASEFDNVFYPASKVRMISAGVIHFYKDFEFMEEAGHLSDHVPVYFEFCLN